ncbi:hypothetical protein EW145_g6995 [Phellinidium pouzarii]|uniref:F-box domain-containing protein n=1 Tax=Phellinidium pouzarii TaxID=167371 RepID=A0A4S4KRS7_9AGAM|nr:hypothetical protein EW145_g6995 [Phellinidium pouzarii]
MSFEITIDRHTLDVLASALAVLRHDEDPVDGDKLWSLETPELSTPTGSNHTLDAIRVQSVQAAIHQLEAVQNALHLLTRSCKEKIKKVKRQLYPFSGYGYDVTELPEDILALIFQFSWDENREYCEYPGIPAVSYVCRRFRGLSLRLPRLWTRVSNFMPQPWIDVLLQRSKNAELCISAYVTTRDRDDNIARRTWIISFMSRLLPHAGRWKAFSIRFDHGPGEKRRERVQIINSVLRTRCTLPVLESFIVDNGEFGHGTALNFYKTWKMPNLHHLSVSQANNVTALSLNGFRSLTSLKIYFAYCDVEQISVLRKYLGMLENLTDLDLDLDLDDSDGYQEDDSIMETYLPKVIKLTLKVPSQEHIKCVMDHLLMPALEYLFIGIRDEQREFQGRRRFLAIRKPPDMFYYGFHCFEVARLLRYFPCLKRITLDAPQLCESLLNASRDSCESFDAQDSWNMFELLKVHGLEYLPEKVFPEKETRSYWEYQMVEPHDEW